jgi:hypothetical protein
LSKPPNRAEGPKKPDRRADIADALSSTLPQGTPVADFLRKPASAMPTPNAISTATSGSLDLEGHRLSERAARAVLEERFARAGFSVETDYTFCEGNTTVNLDGFDPAARVGYQYISHADADVVTDHDRTTELALKALEATGALRILVVHDVDASSAVDLGERIDEFLSGLS